MKVCPRCSEFFANAASFCPLDGSELNKTNDPYLGRTIAARYRLIRRLGSGGMSSVYLARHVMIERLSAIKILRQDLSLDPTHRERFLREARAVNRINHHNIVEITDVGEMDGVAYLVMEYVDGKSLHDEIRRGAFPWPRAVRIAMQIASALGRAHELGVIHRDLKPENILLLQAPTDAAAGTGPTGAPPDLVKLTDFGIAKIIDAPALTYSEQLFGTPGYIAPEYVEGLPADSRSDLYALGVLLYEMMTGALPYDERGAADLMLAPLRSAPIPPSSRVSGLPPDLESLTLHMLARRPDERPQDAFVVHDGLTDILRRYGVGGSASMAPGYISAPPPPRDDAPTLLDATVSSLDAPPVSPITANQQKTKTSEIALRWHTALAEVELAVQKTRYKGGEHARGVEAATELVEYARTLIVSIERATRAVAEAQSHVDRLEAKGREFRANLGHAIDTLGRERSRERAHVAALQARRDAMVDGSLVRDPRAKETMVWETAALAAEVDHVHERDADLSFQIGELQTGLDKQNVELEGDLLLATGSLEGSLSGLRHLTSELVRTLDEAATMVSAGKRPRPSA